MSENTKKPLQNLECIAKDFKTKGYCLLVTITNLSMFLIYLSDIKRLINNFIGTTSNGTIKREIYFICFKQHVHACAWPLS
jgi:hypothetical protein